MSGVAPRAGVAACYAIVGWSFLVDVPGASRRGADWLRDPSPFTHVALAPAAPPDWGADAILVAPGVGLALGGAAACASGAANLQRPFRGGGAPFSGRSRGAG